MSEKHIAASSINEMGQTVKRTQEALLSFVVAQHSLTPAQVHDVTRLNAQLALARTQLITNSVGISVRGMQASVAKLKEVTKATEEAIGKLEDVQTGLRILAGLTSFASAIAMGDVQAIATSGQALAQEVGVSFP